MSAADILDFLRPQFARVNERLDGLGADMANLTVDMADLTARTGRLELLVAALRGDFAGQSLRLDRIETRLDRVERRLGLADATPMSELVYWFNRGRCPDCHGGKITPGPRPRASQTVICGDCGHRFHLAKLDGEVFSVERLASARRSG